MSLDQPTNSELTRQIEGIKADIKAGFEGVHARQDVTNGNVKRNSNFRLQAETSLTIFKWLFGAVSIGNVLSLVTLIVLVYKIFTRGI